MISKEINTVLIDQVYGNRDWTASVFRHGSTAGVIGGRI
jgi:hypothetical protein